jgi:hypothetical protein
MNDPKHDNPSLNSCLYQIDEETIQKVKVSLLVVRYAHFKTAIRVWIKICEAFLSKENYNKVKNECNRIQDIYKDELQKIGVVDEEHDDSGEGFQFFSYIGKAISGILTALFKKKVPKDQQSVLDGFKSKIDKILFEYIKLDLESSENALSVTNKRSTRCRAIVQHQKKLKDQTEEDIDLEIAEFQKTVFVDNHKFNDDQDIKTLLYGEENKHEIIFSNTVNKKNKWNEKKPIIFVISNYG